MNDEEFRALLDLLMVSDPWPLTSGRGALEAFADRIAVARGYADWVEAYHKEPAK